MSTELMSAALLARLSESQALRIGEVAAQTGLTQRTIRYYEEVGLLDAPSRTDGDYRLYSLEDVERLQRIVRLRDLFGLSLAEVRQTLETEDTLDQLRSEYRATDDAATRISKLDEALRVNDRQTELIERKMAQLHEFREEVDARRVRYLAKRKELRESADVLPTGDNSTARKSSKKGGHE
jgi:DNA-binding transcriptional MerR regulator